MRVTLIGFRCHQETTFTILDGELTLIKGKSGVGKSTLFEAISWALYDNVRKVEHHENKNGKLSVTIEFSNLIIMRQKRPKMLTVTMKSCDNKDNKDSTTVYNSDAAEGIIRGMFGTELIWPIVGYIKQGHLNGLLSQSNAEKMDVLNKLAFGVDDTGIEEQLTKIENVASQAAMTFEKESALCLRDLEAVNKLMLPGDAERKLSVENIEQLRNEVAGILVDEKKISLALNDNFSLITKRRFLEQQRDELVNNLKNIPSNQELERKIEFKVQQLSDLTKLREQLNNELASLTLRANENDNKIKLRAVYHEIKRQLDSTPTPNTKIDPDLNVTPQMINQAFSGENQRGLEIKICTGYAVNYNPESVKQRIGEIKIVLDRQPGIIANNNLIMQRRDLEAKIMKLTNDTREEPESLGIINDKIKYITDQISQMDFSRTLLKCPHCSLEVKYQNGVLHPHSTKCTFDSIKYMELTKELTQMQTRQRARQLFEINFESLTSLKNQLSKLPEPIAREEAVLSNSDFALLYQQLNNLNTLTFPIIPIPSQDLQLHQRRKFFEGELRRFDSANDHNNIVVSDHNYSNDLSILKGKIAQNITQITNEENSIILLRTQVSERTTKDNSLSRVESEIKQINSLIVSGLEEKLASLKTLREANQSKIDHGVRINKIITEYRRIKDIQEKIREMEIRKDGLARMKALLIQCECYKLIHTVDNLNEAISEVAKYLFESPITIKINLFKTVKSTGRNKQTVNVTILYKEVEHEDISSLSGGERNLVSLCITLAMNRISGCPLLLLDESIDMMGASVMEIALKSIKFGTLGKTCLLISHSAIEGGFRDTITLE